VEVLPTNSACDGEPVTDHRLRRIGHLGRPETMTDTIGDGQDGLGWRWEDLGWRERVGSDPERIVREALRRAIDIRDSHAASAPSSLSARPAFLVDVLNKLSEVLNVRTEDLWDEA
jgi:hypothetical protein